MNVENKLYNLNEIIDFIDRQLQGKYGLINKAEHYNLTKNKTALENEIDRLKKYDMEKLPCKEKENKLDE